MARKDKSERITDHGIRKPRSGRSGYNRAAQVVSLRKPCTKTNTETLKVNELVERIGTWNVRTMYQAGKIHNAIQEMDRLGLGILGISEMRWPDQGESTVNNHKIFYSGSNGNHHQHGVGVVLNEHVSRFVANYAPVSERVILVQINTSPIKLNIVQVYAPTLDKSDDEVEEFYDSIAKVIDTLHKNEITIIMGDFNSKIGKGRRGMLIGAHGLGIRNERGDRLNTFAEEHQLVVLNTFFPLPPRRLYTWKSPADKPENIIRNQIDFILINKRFRNSCKWTKTFPGADIHSDHTLLVGSFRLKLKKVTKKKHLASWSMEKIKQVDTKERVREDLNRRINQLDTSEEVENELATFKAAMTACKQEHLKNRTGKHNKSWMTDQILEMMEQRRRVQTNKAEYNKVHKEIRRAIRRAKEEWLRSKCDEIEELEKKNDSFNLHKKVKEAAGIYKQRASTNIVGENGSWVTEKQKTMEIWQQYIENLFRDERTDLPIKECFTGPPITTEEVRKAISLIKEGKAPGPDETHGEFLKLLDYNNIKRLSNIFNKIYNTGNIPSEWLKSTFIAIPKKTSPKTCSDYRTISLMSHLLKAFLRIIHQRLYSICEQHMGCTQFGFKRATGTREALFCTQVLFQRCRDVSCDIHACFIDYQKAFDRVQHHKLMDVLMKIGIDDKDLRIIKNLYWEQTANIRIKEEISENIEIKRGVRQGCILSPLLFNIYAEEIFNTALYDVSAGININGRRINNIRFADDTIIFADNPQDLQLLMDRVAQVSQDYGIDINTGKTKHMIISKDSTAQGQLYVNNKKIDRVNTFSYLGTTVDEEWDHSLEIRCRIEKARAAYIRMAKVFRSHELNLKTKIRLLKCYVFPVLLYGAESWTVTVASCKRLEAFEMWLYRRMLRISWTEHVTNTKVLERMRKDLEIVNTVKKRKLEYLGHIMRNQERYGLLQLILQGKVDGKRGPGRRRVSWLKNLRTWFSTTTTGLFRAATNKILIARMIANIR